MKNQKSEAKSLTAPIGVVFSDLLGSNGFSGREAEMMPWPNRDGYWLLKADKANQIKAPNGFVEIVSHENFGKPWRWCYWVPPKRFKAPPRSGCPLDVMDGCEWIGPLLPNATR